ncbi:hypothetical protein V496_09002, partial [Pseudogymnoascus sp. VKM F-4515 (FW-2607)]
HAHAHTQRSTSSSVRRLRLSVDQHQHQHRTPHQHPSSPRTDRITVARKAGRDPTYHHIRITHSPPSLSDVGKRDVTAQHSKLREMEDGRVDKARRGKEGTGHAEKGTSRDYNPATSQAAAIRHYGTTGPTGPTLYAAGSVARWCIGAVGVGGVGGADDCCGAVVWTWMGRWVKGAVMLRLAGLIWTGIPRYHQDAHGDGTDTESSLHRVSIGIPTPKTAMQ